MENKISFAEYIKNEILSFNWEDEQLNILFYSFLKTNGVYKGNKFVIGTSLLSKKGLFIKLFKKFYQLNIEVKDLETKINFFTDDKEFIQKFQDQEKTLTLKNDLDAMAYIAGAFIGKGWVSRPSSRSYHLEFRIGSMSHSLNLQESIDSLGIKSKTLQKGKWLITYIKKSMSLADLLRAMQAHQAMMIFEEERISRDFTASLAKMESIEQYNFERTAAVSAIQLEAIKKLKKSKIWLTLTDDKRNVAELRAEKPEYSLSDLQYTFNEKFEKDVSKSTVNNWLHSLVDLAKLEQGGKNE